MEYASFRSKLLLTVITGILAGIISAVTGWKFGFVWYLIAEIFVVMACITCVVLLLKQSRH